MSKLPATRARAIRALAKAPTGLSYLSLEERNVGSRAITALLRAGLIFMGTSALSMTSQWHLTKAGRAVAAEQGFSVVEPYEGFRLLMPDGTTKTLAEARP